MLYLLPTKDPVRYTGKRPNAVRTFSVGPNSRDKDGNRCVHFSTMCGERYTCSLDRFEELKSYNGLVGKMFTDLLKNGTVVNRMSQEDYDAWLADVCKRMEEANARREHAIMEGSHGR